ncbi:MAG: hypothetical protein IKQ77_02585 [Prevotella sp.]|nr:hypothetical protein [Prevotella sp.]
MKTRFFLTVIAAIMMATTVSAQEKFAEELGVMSYIEIGGHVTALLDMDDDGEEDILIIDVDDSNDLSKADIIVNCEDGAYITVGDCMEEDEEEQVNEHFFEGQTVVCYDQVDGLEVANLDLNGDGEIDLSIIDADESRTLSGNDVVMDYNNGTVATVGEWLGDDE